MTRSKEDILKEPMFFALIPKEYYVIDKNGNDVTVYGNNMCVVLYRDDSKNIKVFSGKLPISDEEFKNINWENCSLVSVKKMMEKYENSTVEEIISFHNEMNEDSYYMVNNGNLETIDDEVILNQLKNINSNKKIVNINRNDNKSEIESLFNEVSSNVLCQDNQIKSILAAIFNNVKLNDADLDSQIKPKLRQHILLSGPSGVGKTEIITELTNKFNLPITIEDSNRYTAAGYVGADVDDIFEHLIKSSERCNQDPEKGIIVLDEIDKLANSNPSGDDVGKTDVQQSLLAFFDGGVRQIEIGSKNNKKKIEFDTSKLTIIGAGAFSGIEKISNGNTKLCKTLGFNKELDTKEEYKERTMEDYIAYGMMPELMGRFSQIIQMNKLDEESLKKIILNSNISYLKLKELAFEAIGVKIKYDEEFIDAVCHEAYKCGCGARSLTTVLNRVFGNIQYDIFSNDYKEFVLKKEMLKGYKK